MLKNRGGGGGERAEPSTGGTGRSDKGGGGMEDGCTTCTPRLSSMLDAAPKRGVVAGGSRGNLAWPITRRNSC